KAKASLIFGQEHRDRAAFPGEQHCEILQTFVTAGAIQCGKKLFHPSLDCFRYGRADRRFDSGQMSEGLRLQEVVDEVIELAITLTLCGISLDGANAGVERGGVEAAGNSGWEIAITQAMHHRFLSAGSVCIQSREQRSGGAACEMAPRQNRNLKPSW